MDKLNTYARSSRPHADGRELSTSRPVCYNNWSMHRMGRSLVWLSHRSCVRRTDGGTGRPISHLRPIFTRRNGVSRRDGRASERATTQLLDFITAARPPLQCYQRGHPYLLFNSICRDMKRRRRVKRESGPRSNKNVHESE